MPEYRKAFYSYESEQIWGFSEQVSELFSDSIRCFLLLRTVISSFFFGKRFVPQPGKALTSGKMLTCGLSWLLKDCASIGK